MKKTLKITLTIFSIIILIILILTNFPLKKGYLYSIYDFVEPKEDVSGKLELSRPLLSYNLIEEEVDGIITITFKNIRSNRVLKKEIEEHISTYKVIKCNNKEFYYNNEGYTIIDYQIKNHFLYNSIHYDFVFGNYCEE